jgi:hypothetical protein
LNPAFPAHKTEFGANRCLCPRTKLIVAQPPEAHPAACLPLKRNPRTARGRTFLFHGRRRDLQACLPRATARQASLPRATTRQASLSRATARPSGFSPAGDGATFRLQHARRRDLEHATARPSQHDGDDVVAAVESPVRNPYHLLDGLQIFCTPSPSCWLPCEIAEDETISCACLI